MNRRQFLEGLATAAGLAASSALVVPEPVWGLPVQWAAVPDGTLPVALISAAGLVVASRPVPYVSTEVDGRTQLLTGEIEFWGEEILEGQHEIVEIALRVPFFGDLRHRIAPLYHQGDAALTIVPENGLLIQAT